MALTQKITSMPSQEEANSAKTTLSDSQHAMFKKPAEKLLTLFDRFTHNSIRYAELVRDEKPIKDALKNDSTRFQLYTLITLVALFLDFFVTKVTILPFAAMFQVPFWIPTMVLLVLDVSLAAVSRNLVATHTGDLAAARKSKNMFGRILWGLGGFKLFLVIFHAMNYGGIDVLLSLDTAVNVFLLALVYFILHACAEGPAYTFRTLKHQLQLWLADPFQQLTSIRKQVRKMRQDARQVNCDFAVLVQEFELEQVVELATSKQEGV